MSEVAGAAPPPPPASPPLTQATTESHPITVSNTDDLKRSRLTVFFRLLLLIPHVIWIYLYTVVAGILLLIGWIAAVFMGHLPGGIHNFLSGYLRYVSRVRAYMLLLANPFPPFSNSHPYPIDVQIAPVADQSRVTVFFRLLLAIPAYILTYVFSIVNSAIAVLMWFYCLFTGRMNEGMRNISLWLYRYEIQTGGYLLLLTGKYPSLSGAPTV